MISTVTSSPQDGTRQLVSEPETSRAWWFLGALIIVRNPENSPRTPAVIDMTFPPGGFAPLHMHAEIDDNFLMLEGEFAVRSGDDTFLARAGSFVSLPHGVAYTTRVVGSTNARMVVIHNEDNFVSLLESIAVPATELRLPREGEENIDMSKLMQLCEELRMPVMGPPMDEDEAQAIAQRDAQVSA
ncbi:cupin domain-containing protein [Rhodococcus sp. MEB064]|uniref:cupin domain-containing protein n=1 Tax=Rhodococcus sp. MEB064 TaxID=1587522 RepID=UPI0005AC86E1|nr:cupin domain-containing protein [Rhodococcus sp. MEB064]KIQ08028.1 hypothetical protein RU01_21775 [Rhodococcus sp. MEB064]